MKDQKENGPDRAPDLAHASTKGPSDLQALVGAAIAVFVIFCGTSLLYSKTYTSDGTLWTGFRFSVVVGAACSIIPGLILGIFFERGRTTFVSIINSVKSGDALEIFCYLVLSFTALVIAMWIGDSYLSISFTKLELMISLVVGAVAGATTLPFALWHILRKKSADT
jgi:hypothetical protein